MKYIVLSFDDGRKDFYTRALPILQKYGLTATLNIVPDFVGQRGIAGFSSGNGECVSWDEIKECVSSGVEIANHSANHTNAVEEIVRGSAEIRERLGLSQMPGFASPNSGVSKKNFDKYRNLLLSRNVKYIRSGNQLKRDGYVNILLYLLYKYTKAPGFFGLYNRRNIIAVSEKQKEPTFLPSVTCNRDNTIRQMIRFIEKMPDDSAAILMFHSILDEADPGFGKDKWFNTTGEFEQLCSFLAKDQNLQVATNEELCGLLA